MSKEITRIAMGVEYEGTAYQGFQKQKSTNKTIQGLNYSDCLCIINIIIPIKTINPPPNT